MSLTGDVVDGVEPGCVLLKAGGKSYLLVGGDRSVIEHSARLTVTGTPQPAMMTTCQQGVPFKVTEVHPA